MFEWNRTALFDIFSTEDDHKSIAEYHFREAIEKNTVESDLPIITNSYTQGRRNTEADLCSETGKLLKLQKSLKLRFVKKFVIR